MRDIELIGEEYKKYRKSISENENIKNRTLKQYWSDVKTVCKLFKTTIFEMYKDKKTFDKYIQDLSNMNFEEGTLSYYKSDCENFYNFWQKYNNDVRYYFAIWEKNNYEFARKNNIIWKWGFDNTNKCHKLVNELKPNDIIINYQTKSKGKGSMAIMSISIVQKYPYEKEIYNNEISSNASVVEVSYQDLLKPIYLHDFREIIRTSNIDIDYEGKPLDVNLNPVNGGYLHSITKELYDLLITKEYDKKLKKEITMTTKTNMTQPLNQILYGPPGTGKTYNTIVKAMSIIDGIKYQTTDKNKGNYAEYDDLKKKFDEYKKQGQIEFITFHQSYSYEEFVEGIKPYIPKDIWEKSDEELKNENLPDVKYIGKKGIFKDICDTARKDKDNNYVLIIDEINRGNISKIFGELITLIEEDKRENVTGDVDKEYSTIKVRLPYSGDEFSVPNNLYIIGTMNTADKSLALLDVALRRRFEFVPMYPKYSGEIKYKIGDYSNILEALNNEILIRKKNADYLIGHSYFLGDEPIENIFNKNVIPLLMEYFNGKVKDVCDLLTSVFEVTFDGTYSSPDKSKTGCEYYYLQVKEIKLKNNGK